MNQAVKFSQSYDQQEDRILLVAETIDGGRIRFWLTQRLANRLVEALVNLFENTDGRGVQAEHQSKVQSWEQAVAVAQHQPQEPVVAQADKPDSLIHTVNIEARGQAYILTLAGTYDSAVMSLNSVELRQWFSGLHSHYVAAAWPQGMWPAWITTPVPTPLNTVSTSIN